MATFANPLALETQIETRLAEMGATGAPGTPATPSVPAPTPAPPAPPASEPPAPAGTPPPAPAPDPVIPPLSTDPAPPTPPTEDPLPTLEQALASLSPPAAPEIKDEELETLGSEISGKPATNPKARFAIDATRAFRAIAKPTDQGGLGIIPTPDDLLAWHRDSQTLSTLRDELDYSDDPARALVSAVLFNPADNTLHPRTPEILTGLTTQIARNANFTPELRRAIAEPLITPLIPQIQSQGITDYLTRVETWAKGLPPENEQVTKALTWALSTIKSHLPPSPGSPTPLTPSPSPTPSSTPPSPTDEWKSRYLDHVRDEFNRTIDEIDHRSITTFIDRALDLYRADLDRAFPNPTAKESWRQGFVREVILAAQSSKSIRSTALPLANQAYTAYQRSRQSAQPLLTRYQATLASALPEIVRSVAPKFLQGMPQRGPATPSPTPVPVPAPPVGGPTNGAPVPPVAGNPRAGAPGQPTPPGNPSAPPANGSRWGMSVDAISQDIDRLIGDRTAPIVPKR